MPREARLVLVLGLALVALIAANAAANKLSKPLEQTQTWKRLFG